MQNTHGVWGEVKCGFGQGKNCAVAKVHGPILHTRGQFDSNFPYLVTGEVGDACRSTAAMSTTTPISVCEGRLCAHMQPWGRRDLWRGIGGIVGDTKQSFVRVTYAFNTSLKYSAGEGRGGATWVLWRGHTGEVVACPWVVEREWE
jgi:hypothetical protein